MDTSPRTDLPMQSTTAQNHPLFKKKKGTLNLLPTQRRLLQELLYQDKLIIVECNKNLGPSIIERSKYILMVLDHLSNTSTYTQLSSEDVERYVKETHKAINSWRETYDMYLMKSDKTYLKSNKNSNLSYFYMTIKAHKTPWCNKCR